MTFKARRCGARANPALCHTRVRVKVKRAEMCATLTRLRKCDEVLCLQKMRRFCNLVHGDQVCSEYHQVLCPRCPCPWLFPLPSCPFLCLQFYYLGRPTVCHQRFAASTRARPLRYCINVHRLNSRVRRLPGLDVSSCGRCPSRE